MDGELTPIEQAKAILGEHFENYLIVATDNPHECDVEYNNSFAALGLANIAHKVISEGLLPTPDNDVDIVWEEDLDEDDSSEF
jgi:DNA helicase HerA-like ATPase